MKLRHLYLGLCIIGAVVGLYNAGVYSMQHGMDLVPMFREQFSTPGLIFLGFDLLITAIVAVVFMIAERKRIRFWWTALIATFAIGISVGLPLFLYLRQRNIDSRKR